MTTTARAALLLAVAVLVPRPAAAQDPCGVLTEPGVAASLGLVLIPVASGEHARGAALGAAWGTPWGPAHFGAAAEYTLLEQGAARPASVRLRLTRRVGALAGFHACAGALAGAATMSRDGHGAWSAGGGLAATVTRPLSAGGLRLTPYLGVRGLGAHTSASILGEDMAVNGLSVGAEGGLVAGRDRGSLALRVTADGFDPGLGATPYPDLAIRLVAAWAF